jgi:hypothetical protein
MFSEQGRQVIDFYEVLQIPRDAPTIRIQEALASYRSKMEIEQNNPYTMISSSNALRITVPGIAYWLLGGHDRRQAYDQQLALSDQEAARGEHGQDLDRRLRIPFFFDPYTDNYDTEEAAYTLREIAALLDREWLRTRFWLVDTSRPRHALVDYIKHIARLPGLAERLEVEVFLHVAPAGDSSIRVDEAIERCLMLLNPQLPRPQLLISAEKTKTSGEFRLDAGAFLPDERAMGMLTLSHVGERGCAFGTIESQTDWLRFPYQQSRFSFALLPASGPFTREHAVLALPLLLAVDRLAHNSQQQAVLTICAHNCEPAVTSRVVVALRVLPLPPRVAFEPVATLQAPARARKVRRGVPGRVTIMVHNRGDEHLIPLHAALSTDDPAVTLSQTTLLAGTSIDITIDTRQKPYGSIYQVELRVDYSPTAGARGPSTLSVQGEILPTLWQSMWRSRSLEVRLAYGVLGGSVSFFGAGAWQAFVVKSYFVPWFLALPLLLVAAVYLAARSISAHWERAGVDRICWTLPIHLLFWSGALGAGLLCDWVCSALPDQFAIFLTAGIFVGMLLGVLGFVLDDTLFAPSSD